MLVLNNLIEMIEQTPWVERKFQFDFPVGIFPIIVERLRGTLPRLREMVAVANHEKLERKTSSGWSAKEHIGHLSDLEELWIARINDFENEAEVLQPADMTNAKTNGANHHEKSIDQLLNQFARARAQLLSRIDLMDARHAGITAFHPRLGKPMRLVDSLYFVAEHDDHHLAIIRKLMT